MKLLNIKSGNGIRLGVKIEEGILDIPGTLAQRPSKHQVPQSMSEVIAGGGKALDLLKTYIDELEPGSYRLSTGTDFAPAVINPGKIICIGLNYRKHAEETKAEIPKSPVLFSKFNNTLAAHGQSIKIPAVTNKLDYEAELVMVMGKRAKDIGQEDALSYIFGYACGNDLSARDLQGRSSQWLLGKTCDGFCPIGPYLVTADEVGNPDSLAISSFVNGERRQNSNTADMIFSCAELVSYLSQHMTLEPGDIILTGTPEGVVLGYPREKRVWLKDGDEVMVEIEKLGRLTNRFRQET